MVGPSTLTAQKRQPRATIALFHSVHGVRPGIHAASDLLRSHGHDARIVEQIGFPALMQRALEAVAELADGFVAAGFLQ